MDDETTFETDCETSDAVRAQPMDVIPESVTRRRWSAAAKGRIVAESLAPGANVAEVARRHEIIPQQLYAWRRELCEREEMTFVPAVIDAKADPPRTPAMCSDAEVLIEIGDVRIRVPDVATADHVERVLLAVRVTA